MKENNFWKFEMLKKLIKRNSGGRSLLWSNGWSAGCGRSASRGRRQAMVEGPVMVEGGLWPKEGCSRSMVEGPTTVVEGPATVVEAWSKGQP